MIPVAPIRRALLIMAHSPSENTRPSSMGVLRALPRTLMSENGLPGMTMVYQVKDEAMLGKVKPGDKVRFTAEKIGGSFVVTDIEAAK